MAQAKASGFYIRLFYFHLSESQLNLARVSQRVLEGGHDVPAEKVISRIPRTLSLAAKAVPLCDEVILLDNSDWDNPFRPVAQYERGQWYLSVEPLPPWAQTVVGSGV